jgi:hypothetical protein
MSLERARGVAIAAALVVLLAPAASVSARPAARAHQTPRDSARVWATVNVCDTPAHPDTLGVRGSMPGSGSKREEMFMRFQAQYLSPDDQRWHNLGPAGDSDFVDVGAATYRAREAGRLFTFQPPAPGTTQLLRGVVTFEWRQDGNVVRRARMRTQAAHRSAAGADPKGYSAATCTLR